jgi:hypothetical protein
MRAPALILKISRVVSAIPPAQFKLMLYVAAVTTILNLFWLLRAPVIYEELVTVSSAGKEITSDWTLPLIQMSVSFLLIIGTVGLSLKNGPGFVVSTIALFLVAGSHFYWYLSSTETMARITLSTSHSVLRSHGYLSAMSCNILVFVTTLVLLGWEVTAFVRTAVLQTK